MTPAEFIKYFDPINFSPKNIDPKILKRIVSNTRDSLKKKFETLLNQGLSQYSVSKKVAYIESAIFQIYNQNDSFLDNSVPIFGKGPADHRFPSNFNSISDHCIFTSAVMDLLLQNILDLFLNQKIPDSSLSDINLKSNLENFSTWDEETIQNYISLLRCLFSKKILQKIDRSIINHSTPHCILNPYTLKCIGRIIGLLHDINKPIIKNHAFEGAQFVQKLLLNSGLDPAIIEIITSSMAHHHDSLNKSDPLFWHLIKIADWISTSDRTGIFDLDFFHILFDRFPNMKSNFSEEEKYKFKQAIMNHNADDIANLQIYHPKSGNHYKWFTTSSEQVFNSAIVKKMQEISQILSKKKLIDQSIQNNAFTNPTFSFFNVEFRSIQKFIFKTSKLRIIQKRSELVEEVTAIFGNAFAEIMGRENIISIGGGGLLGLCTIQSHPLILKNIQKHLYNQFPTIFSILQNYIHITPLHYTFKLYELFFGSEDTGYDFNRIFDKIEKKVEKVEKSEINQIHVKTHNSIINYYHINPTTYSNYSKNDRKYEFLIKFIKKKNFGELISLFLGKKDTFLATEFSARVDIPSNLHNILMCEFCGEHPAVDVIQDADSNLQICELCLYLYKQKDSVQPNKNSVISKFIDKLLNRINSNPEILNLFEKNHLPKPEFIHSMDLDYLANKGKFPGLGEAAQKIAMLKFDGNNIGYIKTLLGTMALNRLFSRLLKKYLINFLLDSMEDVILNDFRVNFRKISQYYNQNPDEKLKYYIPFEPIIIGGDDITILSRADIALEFIERFFEKIRIYFGDPLLYEWKNQNHLFHKINLERKKPLFYLQHKNQKEKKHDFGIKIQKMSDLGEFRATQIPLGFSGGIIFFTKQSPINRVFILANMLEEKAKVYIKNKIAVIENKYPQVRVIGAWNSLAIYECPNADITPNSLEDYYSGVTRDNDSEFQYLLCQFPLSDLEFLQYLKQTRILKSWVDPSLPKNERISQNKLKTFVRGIPFKSPNQNKLEHYYLIGKTSENQEKKRNKYRTLLDYLFPLSFKIDELTKLLVPLHDFISYLNYVR